MSSLTRIQDPTWPLTLTRVTADGATQKARRIAELARSNTSHPSIARTIFYEEAKSDSQGVGARVGVKPPSLGFIFEGGAQNRRLLGNGMYPAGTYRGSIAAEHFMAKAVERERSIPPEIRF